MVTGVDLVRWQIRDRARRAARPRSGRPPVADGPCHRVPDLRRGSRQRLPALAGAHRAPARAGRTGDSRRQRRKRRTRGAHLLRPDDFEADCVGRGSASRPSRACAGRSTNMTSRASRRPCRSSHGSWRSRTSSPAGSTPRIWTRCCVARDRPPVRRVVAGRGGDRGHRRAPWACGAGAASSSRLPRRRGRRGRARIACASEGTPVRSISR